MAEAKTVTENKKGSAPMRPDPEHKEPLQIQVLEKMSQLMTSAFGLVAALAWNDAIKRLIADYFSAEAPLRILFGYAVVITIAAVIVSLWVANTTHKVKAALGHGHPPTTA
jgi:membrane protein YdbS with pleckstrin-like domain